MMRSMDPMDLVCSLAGAELDAHVKLPNPNFPHDPPAVIRHHCTDDIRKAQAWGYRGSGPADVALNVLQAFLPGDDGSRTWDGSMLSKETERLYQAFKEEFIATLPKEGGVVPAVRIRAWIQAHLTAGAAS